MLASELMPAAIVAAAVAPSFLLLWLVVIADARPEPPRIVFRAVLLGALSGIVAGALEVWLQSHLPIAHNPWLAADESALLIAAMPEEAVKVSVIAFIASRSREFDEPMDGIVYGTAVGLGFAALENLLYLISSGGGWQFVAAMRGVLSVPFHGALGAIAGAYVARARFGAMLGAHKDDRWRRLRLLLLAWLVPVILHAAFDASLFSLGNAPEDVGDSTGGAFSILLMLAVAPVVGFGTIIYAVRLARRMARRQRQWLSTKRLPPAQWRGAWAQCLFSIGLSMAAAALLVGGNGGFRLAGLVLMLAAIRTARNCARYLSTAAKQPLSSVAAASTDDGFAPSRVWPC
jgi:RsiW-degrading membrane proteinase PrsW (M82 family)